MKTVFSNDECVHTFAQRTQSEGRTSKRNLFFEGDKLYSYGYHYLLAEFLDDNTIMINDKGYSMSTNKHIGMISWASSQYKQFFKKESDIFLVHEQIMDLKDKLARARKPMQYIEQITSLYESYMEYRTYAKIKTKSDEYKEITKIYKALNKPEYIESIKLEAKKKAAAKKLKDAKALKEALIKFKSGEIRTFRIGNEDYLRLSGDYVETSQGVRVDRLEAKKLYQAIENNIDIVGHRIDGYTVTSLNGTLTIGCHKINRDSVNEIGKQLSHS